MASLQNSTPVHHHILSLNSLPSQVGGGGGVHKQHGSSSRGQRGISFVVRAGLQPLTSVSDDVHQVRSARRQLVAVGIVTPWISLLNNASSSFAAESKKGFYPVTDKKDGYQFFYPFGWQEVVVDGQDKVFKDVIEPLENVSVNMFPTNKQDIRDFGPPQEVAETLIKKVLAPPTQKTKLIQASEHDVDGKIYYTFEFVAQAPNYTRHALSTITIGNGKFYTLTTGANQRRWEKVKDKLKEVVDSFTIFNV